MFFRFPAALAGRSRGASSVPVWPGLHFRRSSATRWRGLILTDPRSRGGSLGKPAATDYAPLVASQSVPGAAHTTPVARASARLAALESAAGPAPHTVR